MRFTSKARNATAGVVTDHAQSTAGRSARKPLDAAKRKTKRASDEAAESAVRAASKAARPTRMKQTHHKPSPTKRAIKGTQRRARVAKPRQVSSALLPGPVSPPPAFPKPEFPEVPKDLELNGLDFDDEKTPLPTCGPIAGPLDTYGRWLARGRDLLDTLDQLGARDYEYRADLRDERFVWLDPNGRVGVQARTKVLCSWSRTTSVVVMAWADPLLSEVGIPRIGGVKGELDEQDETAAWLCAMNAADACQADFLYRLATPHAWYFLALWDLQTAAERSTVTPTAPIGLVLGALGEIRSAILGRAEPAEVVRERLGSAGNALLSQANYAYRATDWVTRLRRTGEMLTRLSNRLTRPTFSAVAAGKPIEQWLSDDLRAELVSAIELMEDEWSAFSCAAP